MPLVDLAAGTEDGFEALDDADKNGDLVEVTAADFEDEDVTEIKG
jgi:hypothetical protein